MTGDFYYLNRESEEWHPKGNVGLHHRKSAEEYQTLGKFIVQAPVFRTKKVFNEIYRAKNTETIVFIKQNSINHWAVKGIYPFEFKVQVLGEWDLHAFSFVNKEKIFTVLGESERGPVFIEFGNILGLKFNVEKNYSSTIPIAKNFIERAVDIMKSNRMNSVKKVNEISLKKEGIKIISKNSMNKFRLDELKEAFHVGFSFAKNRFPQIIENNAVSSLNLEILKKKTKKNQGKSMANLNRFRNFKNNGSLMMKYNEDTVEIEEKEEEVCSKKKIRGLLHPTLDNDHLKDEKMWVCQYLVFLEFFDKN